MLGSCRVCDAVSLSPIQLSAGRFPKQKLNVNGEKGDIIQKWPMPIFGNRLVTGLVQPDGELTDYFPIRSALLLTAHCSGQIQKLLLDRLAVVDPTTAVCCE